MYPFNTIPRPVLAYNQHDPRHTASHFGPYPADIAQNILHQLPLHDAASFRKASMINLYSYFECGEARAEHFARLATERMGATRSVDQMVFNMFSVLDLVRDNSSGTTPASKGKILAGLIDEAIRCSLRPLGNERLSFHVASSIIAATADLPVAERAGMRWRLLNPLSSNNLWWVNEHLLFDFIDAAVERSEDLPIEDRALFRLLGEVHLFSADYKGDESSLAPDEVVDLVNRIAFQPHDRRLALLTTLAGKVYRESNFGPTCQAARIALLSACRDWPLSDRMRIRSDLLPAIGYSQADVEWYDEQRADLLAKQAWLDEYRLLPAHQKPATLALMVRWFANSLRRSGSHIDTKLFHSGLMWTLASTMVSEAAKLRSVHSSAIVMSELHRVVKYFDVPASRKSTAVLRKAFSASNEHDARTRSRQLFCLNPEPVILAVLCANDSPLHPKTKLMASLMLRIEQLDLTWEQVPRNRRDAARTDEAIAIWTEANALGSRRCGDIRGKLLLKLNRLPLESLLRVFDAMLQDARQLSPELRATLCAVFIKIPGNNGGQICLPQHLIDSVVDLAFSLPYRDLPETLRNVMDAAYDSSGDNTARAALLVRVVARCMALPTFVMAPALIELAGSVSFYSVENKPLAASLFYQILEKCAGLDAPHKGPMLVALAKCLPFMESPVLENAFEALISEVDTLPGASRSAWRLYLRVATGYHHPRGQGDATFDRFAEALEQECEALDGPQRDWLQIMMQSSLYRRFERLGGSMADAVNGCPYPNSESSE